jgi:phosphomannomutase|tara:strand:+ start:1271 stop:2044 length:774 start_codon:yes stop_codon:yes gene_type:complete
MKNKIIPAALLFDMDGTLTDARETISNDVVQTLRLVPPAIKKYLVTGSDMTKIEEQIPRDILLSLFERVFSCNGTRVWNCNLDMDDETGSIEPELIHKTSLMDFYSEADVNHIINVLLETAFKTHTKIKTGTFVEWRDSQINFSVVGRNCTSSQREDYVKWDNKSGEREKIVDQLRKEFKGWGLSFRLGGQISIDITREGWDKTYALKNIKESPDQCVFFGDKICKDGNDLDIAMKCGKYHMVDGPADFMLQIQEYL